MEANRFTESEMERLRKDYHEGKILACPRCGGMLMDRIEERGLFFGQVPNGPIFDWLVVECMKEGISGRILLG